MKASLTGVVTPLFTPYENDLSIAESLYLDHAAFCLEGGAHYLAPFGTTGEATSNTMNERMVVLERLVTSGTARSGRLMPGIGLCNLEDTVTLTRHTSELGCAAVITVAPGLSVFPASETLLAKAMALGADGCISASCNSNITAIRARYEAVRDGDQSEADTLQRRLEIHRNAAQEEGLIGGIKSLVAHRSNDRRWLNLRPPHLDVDPAAGPRLATTLPH